MRRKQDPEVLKKKQTTKQQVLDYSCDTEISLFLPYFKIMPITIRSKFLMGLKQIRDKQSLLQSNRALIENYLSLCTGEIVDHSKNIFLVDTFCRFLKLNKLRDHYSLLAKKSSMKEKNYDEPNDRDRISGATAPFEPNIQRQSSNFEPIPFVINPNYENIIKMYKNFTDVHINMEYKIKQINQNYKFFAQPRFTSKILEMYDFESGFSEKGNIVMISFQGSKIIGQRGFAFINKSAIYWWEKNYKDPKQILPETSEDKDQKDKAKRKQGEREEAKNDEAQGGRLNQSFKLTYKLVGHHGKITSMSLSDDQLYLISAGADRTIKLWCLRQKCLLAEYRGHLRTVWSVSFSKSGYFFLSGSADRTVKLWSTDDPIAQRVYIGHQDDVTKVDFMKNPDLLASSSEDKTVRIWNTLTTQCLNVLKFGKPVVNFKTSVSGRYFVSCDIEGKMSLFDLLKGQSISTFRVPQKSEGATKYLKIHDMCFSLDEKQFACVSSKYIITYSFDKICERQSRSLFSEGGKETNQRIIATKEVIYAGRDSNLVYCDYHDKGLLLVGTTSSKKY